MELQPPHRRQGHQPPHFRPAQAAQGTIQPGLQHLQGWGCEQPVLWKVSLPIAGRLELSDLKGLVQPKPLYDSLTVDYFGLQYIGLLFFQVLRND